MYIFVDLRRCVRRHPQSSPLSHSTYSSTPTIRIFILMRGRKQKESRLGESETAEIVESQTKLGRATNPRVSRCCCGHSGGAVSGAFFLGLKTAECGNLRHACRSYLLVIPEHRVVVISAGCSQSS